MYNKQIKPFIIANMDYYCNNTTDNSNKLKIDMEMLYNNNTAGVVVVGSNNSDNKNNKNNNDE